MMMQFNKIIEIFRRNSSLVYPIMTLASLIVYIVIFSPPIINENDFTHYYDSYNDKCEKAKSDAKYEGNVVFSTNAILIPQGGSGSMLYNFKKRQEDDVLIWYKNYRVNGFENQISVKGDSSGEIQYKNVFDLFYHPLRPGNLNKSSNLILKMSGNHSILSPYKYGYLNDNIMITTNNPVISGKFIVLLLLFLISGVFFNFALIIPRMMYREKYHGEKLSIDICFKIPLVISLAGLVIFSICLLFFPKIMIIFLLPALALFILQIIYLSVKQILPKSYIFSIILCMVFILTFIHSVVYWKTLIPQYGGDSQLYRVLAEDEINLKFDKVFDRPPLYPLFLGICYKLTTWGNDIQVINVQIVLSFLSSLLLFFLYYNISKKLLLSFFLFYISLTHLSFHLWSGWILTETASSFLIIAAFLFLTLWIRNHNWIYLTISSLCLCSAAHIRTVFQLLGFVWLFFLLIYLGYLFFLYKKGKKTDAEEETKKDFCKVRKSIIIYTSIIFFLIIGWMLRNHFVAGVFSFSGYRGVNKLSFFYKILDKTPEPTEREKAIIEKYREITKSNSPESLGYLKIYNSIQSKMNLSFVEYDNAIVVMCNKLAASQFSYYFNGIKEALYHYFREAIPGHSKQYDAYYYSIPLIGCSGEKWTGFQWLHNKLRNIYYLGALFVLGLIASYKNPKQMLFVALVGISCFYLLVVSIVSLLSPDDFGRFRVPMELFYITFPFFAAWIIIEQSYLKGRILSAYLLNKNPKHAGKLKSRKQIKKK